MNKLLIFIFLNCCFRLFAQDSLTSADLQGTWNITGVRSENDPMINADIPYEPGFKWRYPEVHWIIKGDQIYEIDYPCCLKTTYIFKISGQRIFIRRSRGEADFNELGSVIQFLKDSMTIDDGLFNSHTTYFLKDTLPEKEVNKLIGGYINPTCLYGDWEIPVGEVSVPFDAIMVYYPFKLQDTLHIEAKNLHHYWANDKFYLEVDGVKRPFRVSEVSLHGEDLYLIPEDWVKKYNEENDYERYGAYSVWLRRIPPIEN